MTPPKYQDPSSLPVSAILGLIEAKDIAVPEIQRPFVWKKTQVRDLLDSLYRGYPAGYIILWQSPNVKMKDGKTAAGRKILIDGQQRITALMTSIAGIEIVTESYEKGRVKIAFNPFAALENEPDEKLFAVQDSSHLRDKRWIADVADVFRNGFDSWNFVEEYCKANPGMSRNDLSNVLTSLKTIGDRRVGVIELNSSLDIDTVTDIFIRINSKGTPLSQGDFVMSKIASDETHGGNQLRKLIDYFAHLSVAPSFYEKIASTDKEFASGEYMSKVSWLRNETEDVFDPICDDVIRVAFMSQCHRAKLSDLVSLLSGRNFETREFEAGIIDVTYERLKAGVLDVVSENHFKGFMNAIHGAGFVSPKLVNSRMAIDFAYTLYLRLRRDPTISTGEINGIVQRWYVLSVLTGRYSSSPETSFYKDLKLIDEFGVLQALKSIETASLSDNFWGDAIPQELRQTSPNNPTYQVYLAAQTVLNDVSLLSKNLKVGEILRSADVHHIFPKAYLSDNGLTKVQYNQNANMAYLNDLVNKSIGKRPPKDYFAAAFRQCETGVVEIGEITDVDRLLENLRTNCIPEEVRNWDYSNYDEFLEQRRSLMAAKIRKYYEAL